MRIPALARRLTAGAAILAAAAALPAAPAAAAASGRAAPKTVPAVVAWGDNSDGQLGDGSTTDSGTPVYVKLPASQQFTTLRSDQFSVAVSASGRVYTWGSNAAGQLGDGTTTSRLTPGRVQLPAGVRVTTARLGFNFTLARTAGGKLLSWGYNHFGQLGTGSTADHHKPVWVKLPKGVKVTAISAGYTSALALTSTGRVLSWGANDAGQLGDGSTAERHRPGYVRLPGHTKIKSIAAGDMTGFAVTTAGRLLAWGYNFSGQLGDGTTKNRKTPVFTRLPTGVKVTAAAAGLLHALALTTGHKVLAWGDDQYGQLGIGSAASQHKPVRVSLPAGTKVTRLTAGEDFGMVLTAGHHVLAWGVISFGEIHTARVPGPGRVVRVDLPPGFTPTGIGAGWHSQSPMVSGRQIPD